MTQILSRNEHKNSKSAKLDIREQLIISQALKIAITHLKMLEDRDNPYPKNGEHAHPSNRADMEHLYERHFNMWQAVEDANKIHKEHMENNAPSITYISDKMPSLKELQDAVADGGNIEVKVFDDGKKEMIFDEEGKLKNKIINVSATELAKDVLFSNDFIVGDVIILSGKALLK